MCDRVDHILQGSQGEEETQNGAMSGKLQKRYHGLQSAYQKLAHQGFKVAYLECKIILNFDSEI